jgi:hypothetical protein
MPPPRKTIQAKAIVPRGERRSLRDVFIEE